MFALPMLRNVLVRNTLLLTVTQGSIYIIPLITTPYLARVLGVDHFGLLGIVSNVIANLTTFTDWGFSLSATKEIARDARDPVALRRIFWDTIAAKAILCAVSLAATLVIMACVGLASPLFWMILAGWLQVFASLVGVGWFLQGLETMGPMVTAGLIGRLMPVPLFFLFVRSPADIVTAVAISGLGGIVAGLFSFYFATRARTLTPIACSWAGAARQLRNGWHIFVSIGATTLYTQINVIVVGAAAGPAQAGLLFGAERLQAAAKGLTVPLTTAIYPRINSLMAESPARAVLLVRRLIVIQGGLCLTFALALFIAAPMVTALFLGKGYADAVPAVRWLSGTVFLVGMSGVFGIQIMLPFGMQRAFMRILVTAGLFNVATIVPLSAWYGATGASISIFLTELGVTAVMGLVVWRKGVLTNLETELA